MKELLVIDSIANFPYNPSKQGSLPNFYPSLILVAVSVTFGLFAIA
jgi:hypothetical protein